MHPMLVFRVTQDTVAVRFCDELQHGGGYFLGSVCQAEICPKAVSDEVPTVHGQVHAIFCLEGDFPHAHPSLVDLDNLALNCLPAKEYKEQPVRVHNAEIKLNSPD